MVNNCENIIRVNDNDIDEFNNGLQMATGTATSTFVLSNGNKIYNLVASTSEWVDAVITRAELPMPSIDDWQEYYMITDYSALKISPPYYYNSENGIGRIKTGTATSSPSNIRAFVRGGGALYNLDLSNSPTIATSTIGYRCAH